MTIDAKTLEDRIKTLEESKADTLPKEVVKKVAKILRSLEKDHLFLSYGQKRTIWIYDEDEGIWKDNAESVIRQYIGETLHEKDEYRSRIANEVVHAIRDIHYQPDVELESVPGVIVVKNGRVNIETGEFYSDFNPDEYHVVRLPIIWDSEAKCDRVSQFFIEVLAGKNDILAMEEEFGYCLFKGWPYDILIMLIGGGANGKTVLLKLLETFLGSENIATVTLHSLASNRFASSHLFKKLANIAGEIPREPIKYTDRIKDLTGGGSVFADVKFEKGFHFKNYAKLIFSSNSPPAIADDSHAWWRRLRCFHFPNVFHAEDPNTIPRDLLMKELTTDAELSGLLNLAVSGWQRLREQGYLSGTKDPGIERTKYLRISDPARYLAETFMEQDIHGTPIIKGSIYEVYLRWCAVDKQPAESPQKFHETLRKSATYITDREKKYPADEKGHRKSVRVYANVRLKTEELESAGVDLGEIDLFFEPVADVVDVAPSSKKVKIIDPDTPPLSELEEEDPESKRESKSDIPRPKKAKKTQKRSKKKTLPREVKKFEQWLSLLPNAGQRGFKESDIKKVYGEGHLEQFSKYMKKDWIEQRKNSKTWWISDTGKAALRGVNSEKPHDPVTGTLSGVPPTTAELDKAIMGLFDKELTGNGQEWHEGYIVDKMRERWPELLEERIKKSLDRLVESHRLRMPTKGNYRRDN